MNDVSSAATFVVYFVRLLLKCETEAATFFRSIKVTGLGLIAENEICPGLNFTDI